MKGKTLGIVVFAAVALTVGVHSLVYACDRAAARAKTHDAAATRVVTVDIEVPLSQARFHQVSMTCVRTTVDGSRTTCEPLPSSPIQSVRHTARVAATLGRALVTTVGAVVGTLVDAAVEASAALV